jgi:hypothetical protein
MIMKFKIAAGLCFIIVVSPYLTLLRNMSAIISACIMMILSVVTACFAISERRWGSSQERKTDRTRMVALQLLLALLISTTADFKVFPEASQIHEWKLGLLEYAFPCLIYMAWPLLKAGAIAWHSEGAKLYLCIMIFNIAYSLIIILYSSVFLQMLLT